VKSGNGGALDVLDDGMGNVVITGVDRDWELVETFDSSTVDFANNDVAQLSIPYSDLQYKELYVIGYITSKDTAQTNANFAVGKIGRAYWQSSFATKAPKYFRAHCYMSPLNYMEVEGSMSEYSYTSAIAYKNGYVPTTLEQLPDTPYIINAEEKIFWFKNSAAFGEATIIKVWGRK
jgi:hypothetical protein